MLKYSFLPKPKWINKIHPVFRIVLTTVLVTTIAISYNILTLNSSIILSILITIISKIKPKIVLKKLKILSIFLILIWITLPFAKFVEIEANSNVLSTGAFIALQITLKSISISLLFISLISTMDIITLGYALNHLSFSKKIIYLIIIIHRYIFLINEEYKKILKALKIRNFNPSTNMHTYKTYSYVMGMLFVRSYERGQRVQNAIICRNFIGKFPINKQYRINWQTLLFLIVTILTVSMFTYFELFI